jgi:ABC-type multidrug transport system ATPase subunit/pSer/pThr/pTyr-binding forkhead associated (FHA) protein
MEASTYPKLILEKGSLVGQSQEILLAGQEVVIGRDPAVQLVIPSPMVSRRHARVYPQNGDYVIEDLGSTNKTFLNGQELVGARVLSPGDSIQIGTAIRLAFVGAPVRAEAETDAAGRTVLDAPPLSQSRTILAPDELPAELAQPPLLVVSTADSPPQTVRLVQDRIRLGRADDNDVVIPSRIVSGHHAILEKHGQGYTLRVLPNTTNPIFYNGTPLSGVRPLQDGDVLRIGSQDPGAMVTLVYQSPAEAALKRLTRPISFGSKEQLQIGRDPDNDVVLDAPIVSRFHAMVERIGQRYRVRDLNSSNGTFVNDRRIEAETWLQPGDAIRIGPYRFVLGKDDLAPFDESGGLRVEVLGLNKWVRKDLNLLQNISLIFQPREFVVVVGQSGGGKSTLVDAIAGYRPASAGQVIVNGTDIYRHFDAIRNQIGFVPQRDIIHTELTVYQALDYAARLRMPADTTPAERHQRIMEVLQDLDLEQRKDIQISRLSGGQQKRVSIGVELLTKPGLFFLDEPTSGLDPGTETSLMHLMRRLADQGRTIVLITHATKNVMLADRVVFLVRGGYVAWFGPPDEALRYFDQFRSERDRRARSMEFDEIYAILDDSSKGRPDEWGARYQASATYQDYIVQPLGALGRTVGAGAVAPVRTEAVPKIAKPAHSRRTSAWRQFAILSSRNIKILSRDRISLILMLASAPLVALLDVALAFMFGRNPYAYETGDMGNVLTTLFQPGMLLIMVGSLAMMREFVKEADVFKRERLVNLKVLPYVMSKLWVAGLLALYQAAAYTAIHYLAFKMPGGLAEFALFYVTLVLVDMAGLTLGLLASAIAPNANSTPIIVALLLIPQVVLGGGLIPVPSQVSVISSARWSFQGLVSITGAASDLARDPCWKLPESERNKLTEDEKRARGCPCMGLSALDASSCSFPGLGDLYDPALSQPEPVAPQPVGTPPPEPVLPPRPESPAPSADQQTVGKFLQDLDAYQKQVDALQADYQKQVADYQTRADAFKAESETYQKALTNWNMNRSAAVNKAEGLLSRFQHDFGWAFVDKNDPGVFWPKMLTAWGAQIVIVTILFVVILFAISRKA